MPKISNCEIYALDRSIYRSGYSFMTVPPKEEEFDTEVAQVRGAIDKYNQSHDPEDLLANKHISRAIRLANAKGGGEDQFLTGIKVDFDLTVALKAWTQVQRYKFLDFVSSFSLMHRAAQFNIASSVNKYVYGNSIDTVNALLEKFNRAKEGGDQERIKEAKLELLYNIPTGFELTAGMSTNYRSLKNIYKQRRHHLLPDWQYVCDWIETLPLAGWLITGKDRNVC